MRSSTANVPPGLAREFPAELSLGIFARMCLVRYFEAGVIDAVKQKEIRTPVYLSTGQEAVAAALSMEMRDHLIFAQHRAHDIYLTFGGPPEQLRDELLGLPSGSSRGRGGSNCLQFHNDETSMFGHNGLIGENLPQAVGAALASGRRTLCIFGDGAAEEDSVVPALGFAVTHQLPVFFVCIDNDLSILTSTAVRRTWNIVDVARGVGMQAIDLADDPWAVLHHSRQLGQQLPALINCRVCREYWHVGTGTDGLEEWFRMQLVEQELIELGHEEALGKIHEDTRRSMEELWGRPLSLRPSEK